MQEDKVALAWDIYLATPFTAICKCGDIASISRGIGNYRCYRCDRFYADFNIEWIDFIKPMHDAIKKADHADI